MRPRGSFAGASLFLTSSTVAAAHHTDRGLRLCLGRCFERGALLENRTLHPQRILSPLKLWSLVEPPEDGHAANEHEQRDEFEFYVALGLIASGERTSDDLVVGSALRQEVIVSRQPKSRAVGETGRGLAMAVLSLSELIAPLTVAEFKAKHWVSGVPFISQPSTSLIEKIKAIDGLRDLNALLPKLTGPVKLFGPKGFRSLVPAPVALDFIDHGYNLYIYAIEASLPSVTLAFADIAKELGFPPWQISIEAFAGRAGGISTRHYDHDINFQILLAGEKRWRLEPNANITNPLRSFHPKRNPDGTQGGFLEGAHAHDPVMPLAFDRARMTEVATTAGAVTFLPRGHWHEVDSVSDTWGINLVFKGTTWATAMSTAVLNRLHENPDFREYCAMIAYGSEQLSDADETRANAHFERLRVAAVTAITEMTRNEVALAPLVTCYRWANGTKASALVTREGVTSLTVPGFEEPIEIEAAVAPSLARLLSLGESFSWSDAFAVGRELGATGLHNLLTQLIASELLAVEPKVATRPL